MAVFGVCGCRTIYRETTLVSECEQHAALRTELAEARRDVEALRAALMEILEECKNEGAYCPIVQDRMLERIELCAMAAIDAARKEAP